MSKTVGILQTNDENKCNTLLRTHLGILQLSSFANSIIKKNTQSMHIKKEKYELNQHSLFTFRCNALQCLQLVPQYLFQTVYCEISIPQVDPQI